VAAIIISVSSNASQMAANIRSVGTNASHVSWTNSIIPVAQQISFCYYVTPVGDQYTSYWRKYKGDQIMRIGCVTARVIGMNRVRQC
jgi:hypothetical protein